MTQHHRRLAVALVAWLAAGLGPASAQSGPRLSGVTVDVRALRANGLGPFADKVRGCLQAELVSAFAARFGVGSGPRLVVRVTGISMPSYVGGESRRFGGGSPPNDYLDGEILLVARSGEVLARHPQLSALPASSGGAWYLPDAEDRRLAALCRHYAQWAERGL